MLCALPHIPPLRRRWWRWRLFALRAAPRPRLGAGLSAPRRRAAKPAKPRPSQAQPTIPSTALLEGGRHPPFPSLRWRRPWRLYMRPGPVDRGRETKEKERQHPSPRFAPRSCWPPPVHRQIKCLHSPAPRRGGLVARYMLPGPSRCLCSASECISLILPSFSIFRGDPDDEFRRKRTPPRQPGLHNLHAAGGRYGALHQPRPTDGTEEGRPALGTSAPY